MKKLVNIEHIEEYKRTISKLHDLTTLASNLIIFLSCIMDKDNYVQNSKEVKDNFIQYSKNKGYSYSNYDSINRAFGDLAKSGLLLKVSKGLYKLNPFYYKPTYSLETTIDVTLSFREEANLITINTQHNAENKSHNGIS